MHNNEPLTIDKFIQAHADIVKGLYHDTTINHNNNNDFVIEGEFRRVDEEKLLE